MLANQIDKLKEKIVREGNLTSNDRAKLVIDEGIKREKDFDTWLENYKKYNQK